MSGERELLQRLIEGPVTGDALARDAGLTRAAMWKRIQALREGGVHVEARPGRGYALATPMELLDVADIRARIDATARGQLAALDVAWSLDSTNSELLRRPAPDAGVDVLLAEQQTLGRGRRGRQWASPMAANLYVSLSRQFSGGLARLGGLSLVAGIAVAEALRQAGYPQVALKWPNDLMVEGRKLGGVLVEGGGEHGGPVRAVVGVGVNVRMPATTAAQIDQPWVDLATLSPVLPSRNQVAAHLVSALLLALDRFDHEGLAPFLPRFAALDALAGREVTLHAAGGETHGVAEGIGGDGALRVRIGATLQHVHAGDVSVRTP
jgi:BirA family biotin operon repressor/biotin-[acetyl-CoA-carboxylase] ligase